MRPMEAYHYIQQVATLGLPPRVGIPQMMKALKYITRTECNPFFWADADGQIIDVFIEEFMPEALWPLHFNRHTAPPGVPTLDVAITGPRLINNGELMRQMPGWEKSDLRNVTLREYDSELSIDFQLRDSTGIRGMFATGHGAKRAPMTTSEMRHVARLVPHFLHAMNAPDRSDAIEPVQGDGTGHVLVRFNGDIVSSDHIASRRLIELHNVPLERGWNDRDLARRLPPAASLLLDRLTQLGQGRDALPASMEVPTRWGLFRLTVHPMCAAGASTADTAILTIQPLIDKRIRHCERLAEAPLSPAERRVALRMAQAGSGQDIADSLGITAASYRQYAKSIYAKMGVDGRFGLKAALDS